MDTKMYRLDMIGTQNSKANVVVPVVRIVIVPVRARQILRVVVPRATVQ